MKTKLKHKFKIGQKVVFRHSLSNIIYEVYAIQLYKKGRIGYNVHYDTTHEIADEYQLKKYKQTIIWLQTKE